MDSARARTLRLLRRSLPAFLLVLAVSGSAPAADRTPLLLDAGTAGDVLVYSPARGLWYNCLFDPDPSNPERFTYAGGVWGLNWTVLPARLTADGLVDVFLYNVQSGEWIWKLNTGSGYVDGPAGTWSPGWSLSVADFDGDGVDDIFVFNRSNGQWYQCLNRGATATPPFVYVTGTPWPATRDLVPGDFNGDGKADLFTYDQATGAWTVHLADTATGAGFPTTITGSWSAGWQVFPGSLNADALTDLFVYNPLDGSWYQCFSTGDSSAFRYVGGSWSRDWDPYPADFNGDGRTDIFVYNALTGYWYVCLTNGGGDGFARYLAGSWDPGWDVHVTDFNGDSRADIFVYRPGSGVHYQCLNVADGQFAYHQGRWDPGWLLASVVGDRLDAPLVPPAVLTVDPPSGPAEGGTGVTITGTWFLPGAVVTIGGVPVTEATWVGPSTLIVRTGPRPAGTVDVVVTNPDGLTGVLAGGFTYLAPPPPTEPRLPLTDIVAFGDSITAGVTSALTAENLLVSLMTTGYPSRVQALLQARYTGDSYVVTNAGVAGELAVIGRQRLPGVLNPDHDLLILLEGVNDLNVAVALPAIVDSLADMIQVAKSEGKRVVLCTLTPTVPMAGGDWMWKGANIDQVMALNALLPALAAAEGVPLVDLFAAFGPDYAQFLSPDGLHPNEAGYERMAEAIVDVIVANFQILL